MNCAPCRFRLIFAGVLLASAGHGQTASARTEYGLHRAVFDLPKGKIRVNLPDDAAAGETLSGTVYVEPAGKNQRETDQNSAELSGFVVEMEGQKSKTSERSFRWTMPAQAASSAATLLLRDPRNRVVARIDVPVDAVPPPPDAGQVDLLASSQAGSLTSAWGPFRSDQPTSVTVKGKEAAVIAQSPRKVVFQTPGDIDGRARLSVRNGSLSAEDVFYVLGLHVTPRGINLLRGQTALAMIQVTGLEDLREPASLAILNHAPNVVTIEGGVAQIIPIMPASVRPDGAFQMTRTLTGVSGGGYDISIIASRPVSSWLPLERLASRTVDRWSRQNNIPVPPDARSLIASGVFEARGAFEDLLKTQVAYHPDPGSLLISLVRDYCFDLRDTKLLAMGHRLAIVRAQRPAFGLGFAPQNTANSNITINAEDVRAESFGQYLGRLIARLTPSQAVGELVVTSQPDKQLVVVDATAGPDNYTARTFVVSVGTHMVAVGSCKQTVRVNAYEREAVNCTH